MPGTSISNIDYTQNDDTANAIEEALNETSHMEQAPQQRAPPQYDPQPPQQYQQAPPQYRQQVPPQYQQHPPQQYQQHPPSQYFDGENFEQPSQYQQHLKNTSGFSLPDSLKNTMILFVILLLLNNNSFKNILTKIPMTTGIEGQHTFIMTLIVCLLIAVVFFITSSVFLKF